MGWKGSRKEMKEEGWKSRGWTGSKACCGQVSWDGLGRREGRKVGVNFVGMNTEWSYDVTGASRNPGVETWWAYQGSVEPELKHLRGFWSCEFCKHSQPEGFCSVKPPDDLCSHSRTAAAVKFGPFELFSEFSLPLYIVASCLSAVFQWLSWPCFKQRFIVSVARMYFPLGMRRTSPTLCKILCFLGYI